MQPFQPSRPFKTLTSADIDAFRKNVDILKKNPDNEKAYTKIKTFLDRFDQESISGSNRRILEGSITKLSTSDNRDLKNLAFRLQQWVDRTDTRSRRPMKGVSYEGPMEDVDFSAPMEEVEKENRPIAKYKTFEDRIKKPAVDLEKEDFLEHLKADPSVENINLSGHHITRADAAEIAKHNKVTSLTLKNDQIGDGTLSVLLPKMSSLEYLDLSDNKITGAGLKSLLHLGNVRSLNLSKNPIKDDVLPLSVLKNLLTLNLEKTGLTNQGIQSLSALPVLENLQLGDPTFDLAALGHLTHLKELLVTEAKGDTLTSISDALPSLGTLHTLALPPGSIGGLEVKALSNLTLLRKLEIPASELNFLQDWDYEALATLPHLEILVLNGHFIGNPGFEHLSVLPLKALSLHGCSLGDISSLPLLNQLQILDLSLNALTDHSLSILAQMGHLKVLDLRENVISPQGLELLQRALPDTTIIHSVA